ncbi:MAG: MerR family transcriptional regulator [Polyangiaceae bacterium]|nr:MerR family transcriptional regulator [Polyangiaceae bacterium]
MGSLRSNADGKPAMHNGNGRANTDVLVSSSPLFTAEPDNLSKIGQIIDEGDAAPVVVRPAKAPVKSARAGKSGLVAERSYSIRVASRLTGIPADTLRMWERRYGFPRPERTGGGSRTYSEADIETLHLLSRAMKAGYRPGEIVGKTSAELNDILHQVAPARPEPLTEGALPTLHGLMQHLIGDQTEALQTELRRAALRLGSKRFVTEVAYPFIVEVGAAWEAGRIEVRHEHLASEALSTLLRLMLSTSEDGLARPIVLLATLPHEQHALGLEMVALYLASQRATPRLLGVNTPRDQIVKAARALSADVVGLTITSSADVQGAATDIRWMLSELPRRVEVWVGGEGASRLGVTDPGLKLIHSFDALEEALTKLRTA